ncbi:MAG: acetate/propionate family kinase [Coriobacteriales bacterium]|jgi:acetate kinase
MLILVLNAGSSSLKCQLIQTEDTSVHMKSVAEKVGTPDCYMSISFAPDFEKKVTQLPNMNVADCLEKVVEALAEDPDSPIISLSEIEAVGNRIVAGGEWFDAPTLIDNEARAYLALCEELAPLHNPHADACIDMMRELLPNTPQVAVFDTAFHQTIPPKAFMYPLPMRYYAEHNIRRYGAHGTSHEHAAMAAAKMLGRDLNELHLITCHLGSGGSIAAIRNGKSIDTTMGFTPLEGIMMGTRCGSIDPAIITFLMRRDHMTFDEVDNMMNKQSGLLGISGVSDDMRDVVQAAKEGNKNAELALEMYSYRIQKVIGSYYAIMPHIDAIVLTAGVGENSAEIRERIFYGLIHLGMVLDMYKNRDEETRGDRIISHPDSPTKICIVEADEEMRIAHETADLLGIPWIPIID